MRDVRVNDVRPLDRRIGRPVDRPAPVVNDGFHLALESLGEFLASPGKYLDAVVLERVVRRRNHEAGIEAHVARDVGDRRRGDYASRS